MQCTQHNFNQNFKQFEKSIKNYLYQFQISLYEKLCLAKVKIKQFSSHKNLAPRHELRYNRTSYLVHYITIHYLQVFEE